MIATRTVVLSYDEVAEAIKTYVRTKYHEKIEKDYYLNSVDVRYEDSPKAVAFNFTETISPLKKD